MPPSRGEGSGGYALAMIRVRPFQDGDVEAWVAIRNQSAAEPITAGRLREFIGRPSPFVRRLVADSGGRVIGIGAVTDSQLFRPWLLAYLEVARGHRGRGLGDRLLGALSAGLPAAAGLQCEVREDDPGSRAWLEARGFDFVDHRFQSRLRLAGWRPPPGLAPVEVVDTTDWDLVFDLFARLLRDTPDLTGEADREWFDTAFGEGLRAYLAVRDQRVIGLALLEVLDDIGYHPITGVLPEARGGGVATALKAAVIERAARLGLRQLLTNNNARNAAMLRVNERLGYVREPGRWVLRRAFATGAPRPTEP